MFIIFIIMLILAYLLGSLNCAILVAKIMQLPDPRSQGSNNPGATNIMRIGGKKAAIITLIGDALKGFIAVFISFHLGIGGIFLALIALAAVLGHIYPVFFNFAGGKGVATTLGAILGLSYFIGITVLVIWLIIAGLTRYVSLASLIAIIAAPLLALLVHASYFIPLAIITALVIYRHLENIQRLRNGTEDKISL